VTDQLRKGGRTHPDSVVPLLELAGVGHAVRLPKLPPETLQCLHDLSVLLPSELELRIGDRPQALQLVEEAAVSLLLEMLLQQIRKVDDDGADPPGFRFFRSAGWSWCGNVFGDTGRV